MGESWRSRHDGSLAIRDGTEEPRRSAQAAQIHAGMLRLVRKCSMRAGERAVQAAQIHAGKSNLGKCSKCLTMSQCSVAQLRTWPATAVRARSCECPRALWDTSLGH